MSKIGLEIIVVPLFDTESELEKFLNTSDCNSILKIDKIIYSNLNENFLKKLEKYIIGSSIQLIVKDDILLQVPSVAMLTFIKNMIDYELLKINIPADITDILTKYTTVININYRGTICDIFKWYRSSGWEFTYDNAKVFMMYIKHSNLESIKWWYENEIPRDYSLVNIDDIIFHQPEFFKYLLNMMVLDNATHFINYFDCAQFITNDMGDLEDECDGSGILNIRIFTDFCLENNVKFSIANIVYDCLYPITELSKFKNDARIVGIYDLFFDNFLFVINSRQLTNEEISTLHHTYLLFNFFENLPSDVFQYVEHIFEFPITEDSILKKCTSFHYTQIITSLHKKDNPIRDKLISEGKLIFN